MSIKATPTPAKALLNPSNHALVLIDFQSQMAFATKSIAPELLRNNAALVANGAAGFNVPTILTTVAEKSFSGPMFSEITDAFPGQALLDRTSMNTWEDEAGDVQLMSAGTGIRHSEYNLEDVTTKIFQIWIIPTRDGEAPQWGAKPFPKGERSGKFVTLASGYDNDNDALPIRTDARVVGATLRAGETAEYPLGEDRKAYLVPAKGAVQIDDVRVNARDGAAISNVEVLRVTAIEDSEIVLVDAA